MPAILPKPKRSDAFKFFKPKPILASLICALALFGVLVWRFEASQANHLAASKPYITPTPQCSAPVQSFCSIQNRMTGLITTGDFSGALAQQAPVSTVKDGVRVQQFAVNVGGQTEYFAMNDYVAFFHTYNQQNGPFLFTGDSTDGGTITMHFTGTKTSKTYNIGFQPAGDQWQLQTPVVD